MEFDQSDPATFLKVNHIYQKPMGPHPPPVHHPTLTERFPHLTKKEFQEAKEQEKKQAHFDGEGNKLDKSYDSMGSKEEDALHYEIDSDNEPPHDEVGDMITVVKKGQVTKEILEVSSVFSLTHSLRQVKASANPAAPTKYL